MPQPLDPERRYVAGLDGIRALAVACVIAYHVGVPWGGGGMLGVGVFFTLSGYLITDLLLSQWSVHAGDGLGRFWLHRARRLLPALTVMLVAVSVWVALFDASQLPAVRRQMIAAVFYVSNWSTIAQSGSYFARFAAPLPLDHLWSLAIEEQFYLLWPWLLLAGVRVTRSRRTLALMTLALAAISAIVMARTYHQGYDPTRAYEGTDTRAFELLFGAALAMLWPSALSAGAVRLAGRIRLDLIGVAGLVVIGLLVWRTSAFSQFLYPYGFLLLSLATVAAVAAVVVPGSRLGAALSWRPLRWVGVRSYAIYLWQWPIIVLINPSHGPLGLVRAVAAVAVTIVISSLSWVYLEEPIRHGAIGRLVRYLRSRRGRPRAGRRRLVISCAALAAVLVPVIALSGVVPALSRGNASGSGPLLRHTQAIGLRPADPKRRSPPRPFVADCRAVVYIGDSTSEGEISNDYIPNPAQQLQAQLRDVGVKVFYPEISGARSIHEIYDGIPNGATVAQSHIAAGYHGCWIIALGTNDVADVAVGSTFGLGERINQMMSIIGDQPVLWVSVVTLVQSGAYAESGMQQWNRDLTAACTRHRNMRVFDWGALAQPKWFIPDGIHYYSPGYVARAHLISQALVNAFPPKRPASPACVVS
ncbi:MAG: acyltransferase family protein [Solirubrobacteraceae bacterium]